MQLDHAPRRASRSGRTSPMATKCPCDSVPRSEFIRHSGIGARRIRRLFGTYNRLVETAGLVPRKFCRADTRKHSSAEVLAEIMRVVRLPDAKLTSVFFGQHSPISVYW